MRYMTRTARRRDNIVMAIEGVLWLAICAGVAWVLNTVCWLLGVA